MLIKYSKFLLFLLGLSFISCDESKTTFDAPFPKRNKDLSNILGAELFIKRGKDTLSLKISSDKNGNLITKVKTGDTLFNGTVCKYRGFYYFNERLNDTSFLIYAVKIDGDFIYGLNSGWTQTYLIDNEIEKGNFPKLVKYINSEKTIIRLHPQKREMKRLFTFIMDSIPADTILRFKDANSAEQKNIVTQTDPDEFEILSKVYPNPTKDFVNVELQQKSTVEYQLVNLNGSLVFKGTFTDVVNKIDLNGHPSGAYALTLVNPMNNQREAIRIIKAQ